MAFLFCSAVFSNVVRGPGPDRLQLYIFVSSTNPVFETDNTHVLVPPSLIDTSIRRCENTTDVAGGLPRPGGIMTSNTPFPIACGTVPYTCAAGYKCRGKEKT